MHTKNIRGIDCIGYNQYDRYRNSTKLHVITDSNNIPVVYEFSEGNIHDVIIAEKLTESIIKIRKDNRRTINIFGDKRIYK